jgi:uncharacterized protein (TIGR03437 family)
MRTVCLLSAVAFLAAAAPQQYVVSTVAGGAPPPLTTVAAQALVGAVAGIIADSSGNLYFSAENCVFKIDAAGVMTRIAGNGRPGYSGDGGPALTAQLNSPVGLAFDTQGNLYIAESGNSLVRKVTPGGVITTVPGSALDTGPGYSGSTMGIAVSPSGDLFISNPSSSTVWKLSPAGSIRLFAGPEAFANGRPAGVAVDASGNVFIAQDTMVRKVSPSGVITTVAGTGISGESGDGGPATQARLSYARAVAFDSSGAMYITEAQRIRKVSSDGAITTVAGGPVLGDPGDGGPATSAVLTRASGVALLPSGDWYIADDRRIRHVSPSGTIETIEGNGVSYTGDGGPGTSAQLNSPSGITLDANGSLYVADNGSRIRKVSPTGTITTVAGAQSYGDSGDGGPATAAKMLVYPPTGMAVDAGGNLFVVEQLAPCVRKISAQGLISTLVSGQLSFPSGLAVNGNGELFVADSRNGLVRKVDSAGKMSTFAGNINLRDKSPYEIAIDGANNVYVSYSNAFNINEYAPNGTLIAALAPTALPTDPMTVDAAGNIYAFTVAGLVKIAPDGATTLVGTLGYSYPVDGAPAATGAMMTPTAMVVDGTGNVFVADSGANAVFKLHPANTPLPPAVAYIVNSASNLFGPIAPGEIVTLHGAGMGPADLVTARLDQAGLLDTKLGEAEVLFDGKPAPLVYVSATQSAAIVPYSVSASTVVTVSHGGQVSPPVLLPVAVTAPAVFTADSSGVGQAAAINSGDGSLNSPAHPAAIGSVITLFATGEGQTNPAGVDGKLAGDPLPSPLLAVTVTIGGQKADVQYAGGAPGEVAGVMQINARIPAGITTGDAVPVVLQVGDEKAQPVTIAVR